MNKKNILPNQGQPVIRTTAGKLPQGLAELSEEALGNDGVSASVPPICICSYDGVEASVPPFCICSYDGVEASVPPICICSYDGDEA